MFYRERISYTASRQAEMQGHWPSHPCFSANKQTGPLRGLFVIRTSGFAAAIVFVLLRQNEQIVIDILLYCCMLAGNFMLLKKARGFG